MRRYRDINREADQVCASVQPSSYLIGRSRRRAVCPRTRETPNSSNATTFRRQDRSPLLAQADEKPVRQHRQDDRAFPRVCVVSGQSAQSQAGNDVALPVSPDLDARDGVIERQQFQRVHGWGITPVFQHEGSDDGAHRGDFAARKAVMRAALKPQVGVVRLTRLARVNAYFNACDETAAIADVSIDCQNVRPSRVCPPSHKPPATSAPTISPSSSF